MSSQVLSLIPPSAVHGEVLIPGSKSYTNRALVLAAMADGKSVLKSPSLSDDSNYLIAALSKLGVSIEQNDAEIHVTGSGGKFQPAKGEINVGPAGTTMRFLTSLCAMIEGCDIVLSGSARMHQRPINDLVDALRAIGAQIDYAGSEHCPPLRIRGNGRLKGGVVKMPGQVSSQYFSSLLMAAPLLGGDLEIQVVGEQISRSYIDMTFDSLAAFRVAAANNQYRSYCVKGGVLPSAIEYQIEGDASGASYFWGIAAISGGIVKVRNVHTQSSQGDVRFPEILKEMGCSVRSGSSNGQGWIEVQGATELQGVSVDMTLMPDTAQTLAVIAATAKSPTYISGLSTLRVKETDRLQALKNELAALRVDSAITDETITIYPAAISPARIKTYDDHRMAMAFAMLGSKFSGINIEDAAVVNKSFPQFWQYLNALGIVTNNS